MKKCSRCKKKLSDDMFHVRPNGKVYSNCKPCQRLYCRDHYLRNKKSYLKKAKTWNDGTIRINRELVGEYLKSHPCVDCGEDDIVVLQFDHVRGAKKNCIANMMRIATSTGTLFKEIDKCDVRCANCHIRKTAKTSGFWRHKKTDVAK